MNAEMVTLHLTTGQNAPRSAVLSVSVVQWWVRLTALTTMFKSGEQVSPVTMQIVKFTKKQRENVAWYSKSFYSNVKGYNMHLKVHVAMVMVMVLICQHTCTS